MTPIENHMSERYIFLEENKVKMSELVKYLEGTTEESWCMEVCKTQDGRSCLLGHIFDLWGSQMCDWFEAGYATQFMFFLVNDGKDPKYPQETPKQRCVEYIKDLMEGRAKNTQDYWFEYGNNVTLEI